MSLPTQCPLCHSTADKQSVITPHVYGDEKKSHAFFRCIDCDVIYLWPQLNERQEKKFYTKEFEKFMTSRSGESTGWENAEKHIKENAFQYERRWSYLKNALPKYGKILEFGCSSGFMLYPLMDKGYECFGIEPSNYFSHYLNAHGIKTFQSVKGIKETFDVVMHFFVLEHVRDPVLFIQENLRLLKKKGQLIVEIPNAADPLYTIYDIPAFEKFYWSIAHHWYFTVKSVHCLLSKVQGINYKILKDQRYDLSNHMIWARDGKPGGMGEFPILSFGELDKIYKKTLIDQGFCDTLVLVIEKE